MDHPDLAVSLLKISIGFKRANLLMNTTSIYNFKISLSMECVVSLLMILQIYVHVYRIYTQKKKFSQYRHCMQ